MPQQPELTTPVVAAPSGHLAILSNLTARPRPIRCFVAERPYSADYTGATNSAEAWQQAADDCALAGPESVIEASFGEYKFGRDNTAPAGGHRADLELSSNTIIEGNGATIKLADDPDVAGTTAIIWNAGRRVALGGTGAGDTDIVIRNLKVDGNKGAYTTYGANRQVVLLDQVDDFTLDNVHAFGSRVDGIVLAYCRRGTVAGSHCYDNLKSGFYSAGSDNIDFIGCHGHGNGSLAIGSTFALALAWWNTVTGCSASSDVGPSLFMSRDTQHCSVTGNILHGIDTLGELIAGPSPFYTDHPGRGATYNPATPFGIYNCLIAANIIRGDGSYTEAGIRILQSDGNTIADNIIRYCNRQGLLINSGNRNVARGNKIQQWGIANVAGQTSGIHVTDGVGYTAAKNRLESNELWDEGVAGAYGIIINGGGGSGVSGTKVLRNDVEATNRHFFGASAVSEFEGEGAGSPNGTGLYCAQGSRFRRTDGGAGTSLYIKESAGSADTGWAAK